jgi:SAM-dependent methyltransferase
MIASEKWRSDLEAWAIPKEIIDQAPESPWIHPPALFQIPALIELTPSHQKAFEALPIDGSILDIGCGGGIAAFAMGSKAAFVIGVDHQSEMLDMFTENAKARNINSKVHEGFWPEIESQVEVADVAVAHHVVYNVQDIIPFIAAMNSHARKRVVIEMPQHHPLSNLSEAWKYFWNLDRPVNPTPQDFMDVLSELGINAHMQLWSGQLRQERNLNDAVRFTRIRLCLPGSREPEVRDFLVSHPASEIRPLATIWWDL